MEWSWRAVIRHRWISTEPDYWCERLVVGNSLACTRASVISFARDRESPGRADRCRAHFSVVCTTFLDHRPFYTSSSPLWNKRHTVEAGAILRVRVAYRVVILHTDVSMESVELIASSLAFSSSFICLSYGDDDDLVGSRSNGGKSFG